MSNYYLGLDLGQPSEFSALAIIETQDSRSDYLCRHLQRWPLRTPYPDIIADVAKVVGSDALQAPARPVGRAGLRFPPWLAVDATGVGAPVVGLLRQARMRATLRTIQITGGDVMTESDGVTRIPKRDLVGEAQVVLQTGRLKIAEGLKEAELLIREMLNFQMKVNISTTQDSYSAWREGAHDDLVLAVALALWLARLPVPCPPAVARSKSSLMNKSYGFI